MCAWSLILNKKLNCSLLETLPCDWEVRGHCMCKEMPVILVSRVVDSKRIIRKMEGRGGGGTRGRWPQKVWIQCDKLRVGLHFGWFFTKRHPVTLLCRAQSSTALNDKKVMRIYHFLRVTYVVKIHFTICCIRHFIHSQIQQRGYTYSQHLSFLTSSNLNYTTCRYIHTPRFWLIHSFSKQKYVGRLTVKHISMYVLNRSRFVQSSKSICTYMLGPERFRVELLGSAAIRSL
jgi:hypothetical protein